MAGKRKRRSQPIHDSDEEVGDSNYLPPTSISPRQMHSSPARSRYSTRQRAKAYLAETGISQSSTLGPSSNGLVEAAKSNPETFDGSSSKEFNSKASKIQVPTSVAASSMDPNDNGKRTLSVNGTLTSNGIQELELNSILGDLNPEFYSFAANEVMLAVNHQASMVTDIVSETNINRAEGTLINLKSKVAYLLATNEVVSDNHQSGKVPELASKSNENRAEGTENFVVEKDKKQLTRCPSINYTEIAARYADEGSDADEVGSKMDPALVTVNGYRVKQEVAPLLRSIISKYGDIAKESTSFSIGIRSLFLEMACSIYQKLEKIESKYVTLVEIKSMVEAVQDLKAGGVEVEWLSDRLDEVADGLHVSKQYTGLKQTRQRDLDATERKKMEVERDAEATARKKKEWEELEERVRVGKRELVAIKAREEKSSQKYLDLRDKMKILHHKSLVYGLLDLDG